MCYPTDSNLSSGQHYPPSEQLGPEVFCMCSLCFSSFFKSTDCSQRKTFVILKKDIIINTELKQLLIYCLVNLRNHGVLPNQALEKLICSCLISYFVIHIYMNVTGQVIIHFCLGCKYAALVQDLVVRFQVSISCFHPRLSGYFQTTVSNGHTQLRFYCKMSAMYLSSTVLLTFVTVSATEAGEIHHHHQTMLSRR